MKYWLDTEVRDVATRLIEAHHPHLKQLKVAYIMKPEGTVSNGKVTAGMCIRCDDRAFLLHGTDFIMEIAKNIWDDAQPKFQEAIVDHELSHMGVKVDEHGVPARDPKTGRIRTYVKHHDMEEFEGVVERYGAYRKDLRSFLDSFKKGEKKVPA